jgi:dethiobiotin synthetase
MMRVFVVGTDTGVGKTEAACALLSLLADAGQAPRALKPYESGVVDLDAPADALALRAAARSDQALDAVCPHRFRLPVAPGVAALREGLVPDFGRTEAIFAAAEGHALVVEGAGGLLVPLHLELGAEGGAPREVLDLVAWSGLPVLLVARAGLGTLNHTGLSLGALAARGIPVLGVLLVRTSRRGDPSERDNPRLLVERHGVRVLGPVPWTGDPARRRAAFRRALRPLVG